MSAPTLQWLQELHRRKYDDLADCIARSLICGSRVYTLEMYEVAIAGTEALYPWMHLTRLLPWPWVPQEVDGGECPDRGMVGFDCSVRDAVAAGMLSEVMVPQGRKRKTRGEYGRGLRIGVDKLDSAAGIRVSVDMDDSLPDTHALATFRPSAIRAATSVMAPAAQRMLRLVVDNTRAQR